MEVSDDAFMPSDDGAMEKTPALLVPDLTLSSPAIDAACPAASSRRFTRSAVTDGGAAAQRQHQQAQQQRKARRCWSPELHRQFVAALQQLGGAQVAKPKHIRKLMKVDGLTNDEVKSHLQKYRLHTYTWRASSSDGGPGGDHHAHAAALEEQQEQYTAALEEQQEQYTALQHSTSQSGSPSPQDLCSWPRCRAGPCPTTPVVTTACRRSSTRRCSTARRSRVHRRRRDLCSWPRCRAGPCRSPQSCDGCDEAKGGGRSDSYSFGMQQQQQQGPGTRDQQGGVGLKKSC